MGGEGEGGEARFLVVGFLPRLVRPERMADTTDVCQVLVEGRAAVDLHGDESVLYGHLLIERVVEEVVVTAHCGHQMLPGCVAERTCHLPVGIEEGSCEIHPVEYFMSHSCGGRPVVEVLWTLLRVVWGVEERLGEDYSIGRMHMKSVHDVWLDRKTPNKGETIDGFLIQIIKFCPQNSVNFQHIVPE